MLAKGLQILIRELPLDELVDLGDETWQDHNLRRRLLSLGLVRRIGEADLYAWTESGRAVKIIVSMMD